MREIKTQTLSFLGRGSMFNVKEGNTSAYWKNMTGETMILIDCGCTVFQKIDKLNLLDGVKSLLIAITHTHTDHIGSLSDLIHYCIFCRPDMEVNILCYYKTMPSLNKYLNCTGTSSAMINSNVKASKLMDMASLTTSNGKICDIEFIEDDTHRVLSPQSKVLGTYSCGILIKFGYKTIYYSGDTMRLPYESLDLERINEIYVDCAVRLHSPGSSTPYPHYNLYNMINDMKSHSFPLDRVYTMHLDCDGVIDQCNMMGISVVEVEV